MHTDNLTTRDIPAGVGRNIKRLRKERHMSLAALSEACGVSTSYLCRIENNSRMRVSYAILNNVAKSLGTELTTLIDGVDVESKSTEPATIKIDQSTQKHFVFAALKDIVESERLSNAEKLKHLNVLADISRFLLSSDEADR
jgi:transcriptional regulator with XRE-family HTH domain